MNIQPNQPKLDFNNTKLLALELAVPERRYPSDLVQLDDINTITNYLTTSKDFNWSEKVKLSARGLENAHSRLKIAQTKFDIARTKEAKEGAEKDLHSANKKVKNYFQQLKNEYIDWYKKNESKFWGTNINATRIYNWLQSHAWNSDKQETVFVPHPAQP